MIDLSSDTETILSPSGLYLTPQTWSWWSSKVWTHDLLANSQILTEWSELLETKCVLSGEKSTPNTHDACPDNVPTAFACCLDKKKNLFYNWDNF